MDIEFIALNIVKQIIFFVFNVYVLSYISTCVYNGQDDSILPAVIEDFLFSLCQWTIGFVTTLAAFLVRFVSGAIVYSSIEFKIRTVKSTKNGTVIKYPTIEYDEPDIKEGRSYFPLTWIGGYLGDLLCLLTPLAFAVVGFRFLAPDSFASVAETLKRWTEFSSGTPNSEFFAGMFNVFWDIVWNKFIIGIAQENVLLLIAIIFVFFLCLSGAHIPLETKEGRGYALYAGIGASLLIICFNVCYAVVDYSGYVALSSVINAVGMILLLVLIIGEIVEICQFSGKKLISLIRKK